MVKQPDKINIDFSMILAPRNSKICSRVIYLCRALSATYKTLCMQLMKTYGAETSSMRSVLIDSATDLLNINLPKLGPL